MRIPEIALASHNEGKLREFAELFEDLGIRLHPKRPHIVPEETGRDYLSNALIKARQGAKTLGVPCVGEDSGIEVAALNDLPGPFSHRFHRFTPAQIVQAMKQGTFMGIDHPLAASVGMTPKREAAENRSLLLQCLQGRSGDFRAARYMACVALVDRDGRVIYVAHGSADGRILQAPIGDNGFGYDPIMELYDFPGRSVAELSVREKNAVSHRGYAMRKLAAYLRR